MCEVMMMIKEYKELLLGCGSRTNKDLFRDGKSTFSDVTRLDYNPDHKPDIVHDLTIHPLPFRNELFDEIHAYDILEHLAYQGDYEFFFSEFEEYWRILKPGGVFFGSVPHKDSIWALGDPSHKRIIVPENLLYLDQDFYNQVGQTKCSDFRRIYHANFKLVLSDVKYTDKTVKGYGKDIRKKSPDLFVFVLEKRLL